MAEQPKQDFTVRQEDAMKDSLSVLRREELQQQRLLKEQAQIMSQLREETEAAKRERDEIRAKLHGHVGSKDNSNSRDDALTRAMKSPTKPRRKKRSEHRRERDATEHNRQSRPQASMS